MAPVNDPFGEEWFGPESQAALADLYRRVVACSGEIVEVGCWTGRSTVALANACVPHVVHAVDTWLGSPGEISETLAAERDVFAEFQANIRDRTVGNVAVHRMDWRQFFASMTDPIRLLHIDAEHSYSEVSDNIAAALPLMVPGGIIAGDDAHHPPVQRAVVDAFGDANLIATLWWVQL
jgi:predicted O-methyltransferase YrrM